MSNPVDHPDELINSYLDGMLTAEQEARLNAWVKASAANASRFATAVVFDTRLGEFCRSAVDIGLNPHGLELTEEKVSGKPIHRRRLTLLGGLAAAVMFLTAAFWWLPAGRVNAATELERLIALEPDSTDRTYRIVNLDPYPEQAEERRPPIDGAILYVRQPDKYMLRRTFPDGSVFLTGCDGRRNWAVPPDGAVRVSGDPQRFRGPLPGHHYGLPFVNLKSDLMQLREAYDLAVLQQDQGGLKGLVGFKKSHDYRGPRQVMLWYEAGSGVIRKMQFDGMPQARGGPNSVAVDLVEQGRKPADFYDHQSHHAENVTVVEE